MYEQFLTFLQISLNMAVVIALLMAAVPLLKRHYLAKWRSVLAVKKWRLLCVVLFLPTITIGPVCSTIQPQMQLYCPPLIISISWTGLAAAIALAAD